MLALVPPPFTQQQHSDSHRPSSSSSSISRQSRQQLSRKQSSSSSAVVASSSRSSSAASSSAPRHPPNPTAPTKTSTPRHPIESVPPAPVSAPVPAPTSSTPEALAQLPTPPPASTFDIHSYPSTELLRLLASLLTQIASTNDKLSSPSSPSHPQSQASHIDSPIWQSLTTASRTSLSNPSSALTFHARNIPTITLEAYLLRILKYCPTTNEVFLSLLVYFDRMSKLAGEATGRTFVIDSFNVHRLVIAGVTVASKFFSDVFYTNSRYAKVRFGSRSPILWRQTNNSFTGWRVAPTRAQST